MKNIIEALLIATDTPLSIDRITEILDISHDEIKKYVAELNQEYQTANRAFEIKEVAGGYQIYTLPHYAQWVGELHKKKEKLSKAALETLAIVAYHQPITRAEIEKTRGVDSSWILDSLLQRGLIKTCGRVQAPGRPIKYATTSEFLRYFGINSLNDLPQEEHFVENAVQETVDQSPHIKIEKEEEEPLRSDSQIDLSVGGDDDELDEVNDTRSDSPADTDDEDDLQNQ